MPLKLAVGVYVYWPVDASSSSDPFAGPSSVVQFNASSLGSVATMKPLTEVLLAFAARTEHLENLIEPAHGGTDGRALFAGLLEAA